MAARLFKFGQFVLYTPDRIHRTASASGRYFVLATLPADSSGHQYRIRSEAEGFDRIAKEHELHS